MNRRLVIGVLALVILPTAVLSLLAGRALRNREIVLRRRLEAGARNALETVAFRMQAHLESELEQVRQALVDALPRTGTPAAVGAVAQRLETTHALIERVYVFMDPWGFLWPETDGGEAPPELTAALRREIAAATALLEPLCFTVGGATYCFRRLELRSGLYGGFRVDSGAFGKELLVLLEQSQDADLILKAEGPGLPEDAVLTVRDSLAPGGGGSGGESAEALPLLATLRLRAPFDFLRLSARLRDPEAAERAAAGRARLYAWGIGLLAAVVLAGAWFTLHAAAEEIRLARSRSDFVVGVSHDLRTPIASMRLMAESLQLGYVSDPAKRARFLETMVRECERLSQLIERVLFFVRFGQRALQLEVKPLDPVDLVRRTAAGAGASAETGSAVRVHAAEPVPCVRADETALQQVMLNLLDNARKYGDPDGRRGIDVNVAVERRRRGWRPARRWVRIAVRDYGIGIASGERRKIFRRFYRS
ncbi:MAG: hypothetical protein JW951_07480, partial [Lentisphaerae bacterium]|nr:hypothetical protein [Lentisphaerota bacterium]